MDDCSREALAIEVDTPCSMATSNAPIECIEKHVHFRVTDNGKGL